jgi:hypothetical protein
MSKSPNRPRPTFVPRDPRSTGGPARPPVPDIHALKGTKTS